MKKKKRKQQDDDDDNDSAVNAEMENENKKDQLSSNGTQTAVESYSTCRWEQQCFVLQEHRLTLSRH
eukprot:3718434-Ditylum_brightwellii.AAC.1